ncbi:hypothetical protein LC593_25675 [Nostoc sp. CHAB 5844]|nr:hypothetical protein [Nostoc sp. CHAB 5844]
MSTYQIKLQGDILKVGFGNTQAKGDRIVRDVAAKLDEMIATGELPGGSLIKINGRVSVLVSQVLGDKLGKLSDAIAIFDPKIGDKGLVWLLLIIFSLNQKYMKLSKFNSLVQFYILAVLSLN